jgi:hypothetical protein
MRNLRLRRLGRCSVALVAVFMAIPATAFAQEGGMQGEIGSLPLTGTDLLIVVGVSGVLAGTGLAVRRLSRLRGPRNPDTAS